jgi:tetratricopeptide (TPR) repeat protein
MDVPQSLFDIYSKSAQRFAGHYRSYAHDYKVDFIVLDEELGNLIRALAIYNHLQAWLDLAQLIQELGVYLDTRGYWDEHRFWLEKAIAYKDMIRDPITKMGVMEDLATIVNSQGDRNLARGLYQEVITIAEQEKDEMRLARAYFGLGVVNLNLDKKEEARACWEKALGIAERIKDEIQIVSIRFFLGSLPFVEAETQNAPKAKQFPATPTILVASQAGGAGKTLSTQLRAMKYFMQGRYRQARSKYLEALDLAREEGERQGEAFSLYQLGQISHLENNLLSAMDYYRQSESIAKQIGDHTGLRSLYSAMGLACIQQQRFDLARSYLEQSVVLEREADDQMQVAEKLYWLGYALANSGELERGKSSFEESLVLFDRLKSPRVKDVRDVLSRLGALMDRENG